MICRLLRQLRRWLWWIIPRWRSRRRRRVLRRVRRLVAVLMLVVWLGSSGPRPGEVGVPALVVRPVCIVLIVVRLLMLRRVCRRRRRRRRLPVGVGGVSAERHERESFEVARVVRRCDIVRLRHRVQRAVVVLAVVRVLRGVQMARLCVLRVARCVVHRCVRRGPRIAMTAVAVVMVTTTIHTTAAVIVHGAVLLACCAKAGHDVGRVWAGGGTRLYSDLPGYDGSPTKSNEIGKFSRWLVGTKSPWWRRLQTRWCIAPWNGREG